MGTKDTKDKERITARRTPADQTTKEKAMERTDTKDGTKEKDKERTTKEKEQDKARHTKEQEKAPTERATTMAHNQWTLEQ